MQDAGVWGWLGYGKRPIGGCLTLARGVTPTRVLEVFEMDPQAVRMLSEQEARDDYLFEDRPWVRVGQTGEWAFAIEEIWMVGFLEYACRRLSAGTEAVVVSWTDKGNSDLTYWVDGDRTTSFEPGRAYDRSGSDPDRFLPQMRQVGLPTDRDDPELSQARVLERRARILRAQRTGSPIEVFNPFVAALNMLTLALGIRLPEHVVRGPLLTVQRRFGAEGM